MTASRAAYDLIRRFEALKLEVYRDSAGVLTIGYGHTRDAQPGMRITEAEAEDLLRADVQTIESIVSAAVRVTLAQHQFDALVSFAFNVGRGAFVSSTLLANLNSQEFEHAAQQFERWVYITEPSRPGWSPKKTVLPGLVARREAERALFEGKA